MSILLNSTSIENSRLARLPRSRSTKGSFRGAPLHDLPVRDEVLYQYLDWAPDLDVLEVGPGSGYTAFWLSRQVRSMTLLDVASQTIDDLRVQLSDLSNIDFYAADVSEPGLAHRLGRQFGAIIALAVLDLIPDPAVTLRNLSACLQSGGQVLLTFPNLSPPYAKGPTFFRTLSELEHVLEQAEFGRWRISKIHLNPAAQFWFGWLHEFPIRFFRRLRKEASDHRPRIYQATWAFQNRGMLSRVKWFVHMYWHFVEWLLRSGGDIFVSKSAEDPILNSQLLVEAWK